MDKLGPFFSLPNLRPKREKIQEGKDPRGKRSKREKIQEGKDPRGKRSKREKIQEGKDPRGKRSKREKIQEVKDPRGKEVKQAMNGPRSKVQVQKGKKYSKVQIQGRRRKISNSS
ncbi:hypothetical protein EAE99_007345 [Botrytis elliptica]|nr:hypothetical protein EAE99_007345 [Botrytis elliptica]